MTHEPPVSLWPDPDALGPVTDLYQLTMMAGYSRPREGRTSARRSRCSSASCPRTAPTWSSPASSRRSATCFGWRSRPSRSRRSARWPVFAAIDPGVLRLAARRFGSRATSGPMPEGTVVFPGEPLIRVEAPLAQAQWVETFLLASLGYPTLVASKAARIVEAAAGRPVFDFGARRGHGPQAGLLAARSAYLAGFAGTSHVEAAIRLGIPCSGTMAHSWVQSFDTETEAFAAFARDLPGGDDAAGRHLRHRTTASRHAAAIEPPIQAVRLDSGDLGDLAREARADPRRPRSAAGPDPGLGRPRRVVDRPADRRRGADRRVRRRDRDGHQPRRPGAGDGLQARRARRGRADQAQPGQEDLSRGPSRSTASATPRAGSPPIGSRRPTSPPKGSPCSSRSSAAGSSSPLCPASTRSASTAGEQLAALPDALRGPDAEPIIPSTYSDVLEAEADRPGARFVAVRS